MAGSIWPLLTSGNKAKGSEVEAKFDWIEGSIVPMTGGNKTNGVYDLGETSYHWQNAYINNIPTSLTVNDLTLNTTSTRYYAVPACNFVGGSSTGWIYKQPEGNTIEMNANSNQNFYAPVHLPHNAIVTSLGINAGLGTTNTIVRIDLLASIQEAGGFNFYTAASMTFSDTTLAISFQSTNSMTSFSTIDNNNYSYYLQLYIGMTNGVSEWAKFGNAKIIYTVNKPLP